MDINSGFDMVPPLSKGQADRDKWGSFMKFMKNFYQYDDLVEVQPNYIVFKAGEHPKLPFEGHKFLRFSSKISGRPGEIVVDYIKEATRSQSSVLALASDIGMEHLNSLESITGKRSTTHMSLMRKYSGEPEIPATIAQVVSRTDPISQANPQFFEVQAVPGKGRGLVACARIGMGKWILSESPIVTSTGSISTTRSEEQITAQLKAVSRPVQRQFLSLHNNFPGKQPFSGIFRTNALPCGPGSSVAGVYPTISLINHSCLANAHFSWNSVTKCEDIHAIRAIDTGEEITICYMKGHSFQSRQDFFKDSFGFTCTCELCSLPPAGTRASDARRLQIRSLDNAIDDRSRTTNNPEACLADCHRLLKLLEDEYRDSAGTLIAILYYDAYIISITHGDEARASVFAGKSYISRATCEGRGSPEARRLKGLMDDPTNHANFGTSMKWKSAKADIPKGVDAVELEKWLWRGESMVVQLVLMERAFKF